MHKNTSKENPVVSDVYHLRSGDKRKQIQKKNTKRVKLENIHQRNISSCTNTGVHDFIKLNKQNTQQFTDIIELGEIYFSHIFKLQSKNIYKKLQLFISY